MSATVHSMPADGPSQRPTVPPSTHSESAAPVGLPFDQASLVSLASAMGVAFKSAGGSGGGASGPYLMVGLMVLVVFGSWIRSEAQTVAKAEAEVITREAAAKYEARTAKIEVALEGVRELPDIKRAVDRLIEDQRKLAGSVETLSLQIAKKEAQ